MISAAAIGCLASCGGEWDPRSIPDLVSDFDARFGVSTSGPDVTDWAAAKGLAYNFDPVASTPQFEATGWVGTRRTSPSIHCASDTLLSDNTVGGIPLAQRLLGGTDQPGTILMAYQLITTGLNVGLISFTKAGLTVTDQRIVIAARLLADNIWRCTKVDDSLAFVNVDSTDVPGNTKSIMSYVHSGIALEHRIGNVLVSPPSSPPGSQNVGAFTVDQVELSTVYGTQVAEMRIARVIFYSRALSSTEIDAAYAGLNHLYG